MSNSLRARLITIIAAAEFQDRLGQLLIDLGVSGYTTSMCDGRGKSGQRLRSFFEISNLRLETIVPPEKAEAILAQLGQVAETLDILVFSQDVDALPRKHVV
jgi:nitrogen regulatory protein PII